MKGHVDTYKPVPLVSASGNWVQTHVASNPRSKRGPLTTSRVGPICGEPEPTKRTTT